MIINRSRVRYVRVKDVGTRITDIEKRNKRIVEIAVPLPEDKRLSGRAVYWLITHEEVEAMFDNSLFVWKAQTNTAVDGTSYFLNQFDFRKQKGMISLRFLDGMVENIVCYAPNASNSNKRGKFNSTQPVSMSLVNSAVSTLQIDDKFNYEDNDMDINNTNQTQMENNPTFEDFGWPFNNDNSPNNIQQGPQILSNGAQISANKPVIINILLLVPDIKEYIEMAERALVDVGFVKDVSSENQQHLYSEKDLVTKCRHVLLFPYGKMHRYSKIQDRLSFASEVILILETNNLPESGVLMAVSCVLHVFNNSMNTRHFKVKTEAIPTTNISYQHLTESAQHLFFINELFSSVVGCISCKQEANIASFFLQWNLAPTAGHVVQNIFICFKYEPITIKAFTEYAMLTLNALGINCNYEEALVVNGSVLVYVQCPSYIPWYIQQHAEEIFGNLKEEQLTEIYECSMGDVDASLEHPNNEEFTEELKYFKELMISDGIAQERHKRSAEHSY